MTQPNRESVYAALLTLLTNALGPSPGSGTFKTISRRLVGVTNFPANNAPALFQVENGEEIQVAKGLPAVRKFTVHLVCYANYGGATDVIPSTALNNLVTAVEGALGPSLATGFQQLGIPVSSVLLNGRIEYFEQVGTAGNWSCVLIPVEIVATY